MSTHGATDDTRDEATRLSREAAAPGRAVERTIEIDAPTDVVWKALTDAEELMRWFPLEARVTPGPGGSIWMRWDRAGELDDTRIEIWEPARHLRTVGVGGTWLGIATDYYLQARGGGTVLRVVSSGFGAGADWDEVYEGFGNGWDFELRGLRHYLTRHRGRDRVVAWARTSYTCSDAEAWARLAAPGGWLGAAGTAALVEGARYALRTATGDVLEGVVQVNHPPRQFAATVDGWNDGYMRAMLYGHAAWAWLATYGVPAGEVEALERRWQEALDTLYRE